MSAATGMKTRTRPRKMNTGTADLDAPSIVFDGRDLPGGGSGF